MFDKELVCSIVTQIDTAIATIQSRCAGAKDVAFFTDSPQGMEKLDGVCMLFIAIGESIKNVDKITGGTLLVKYPSIDWQGVKGFRDIVAHHYFDIDAEQVYWIVSHELKPLSETIQRIIQDINS
jgi:uncharacterized protein with HEPN domain